MKIPGPLTGPWSLLLDCQIEPLHFESSEQSALYQNRQKKPTSFQLSLCSPGLVALDPSLQPQLSAGGRPLQKPSPRLHLSSKKSLCGSLVLGRGCDAAVQSCGSAYCLLHQTGLGMIPASQGSNSICTWKAL